MASVVFAGGGTAGHIEPALAVARAWAVEHPSDTIVFIGTKTGLENTLIPSAGFTLTQVPKVSISRRPSLAWLRTPFDLFAAVRADLKSRCDAPKAALTSDRRGSPVIKACENLPESTG